MLATTDQFTIPGPANVETLQVNETNSYSPENLDAGFLETAETAEAPYLESGTDALATARADARQAEESNSKEVNRALNPAEIRNFAEGAGQRIVLLRNQATLKQETNDISFLRNRDAL